MQRRRTNRGFTLVELMVSMAVTLIVLGTALTVFKKSMDAATTVTAKAEMQADARAAINGIVRDLSQAGSGGMPWGGITGIPVASLFAHDTNGNDYFWLTEGPPTKWIVVQDENRGEKSGKGRARAAAFIHKRLRHSAADAEALT